MAEFDVIKTDAIVVEEHLSFTLVTLCQAAGAGADEVHALVAEGLLTPVGHTPDDWRFGGEALPQTRRALRLARDLELGTSGVALVMELLAEIERLKSRLRRR